MKNKSIYFKVYFVVFILLISMIFLVILSYKSIRELNKITENITDNVYSEIEKINHIKVLNLNLYIYIREIFLEKNQDKIDYYNDLIKQNYENIQIIGKKFVENTSTENRDFFNNYLITLDKWKQIRDKIYVYKKDGQLEIHIQEIRVELKDVREELSNLLDEIIDKNEKNIEDSKRISKSIYSKNSIIIYSFSFFTILFSIILSFIILSKLKFEIDKIISELKLKSNNLLEIAEKINKSSISIKDMTNEQASNVTETSASLNEISSMLNKTSESSSSSKKLSEDSTNKVEESKSVINKLVTAMEQIQDSNQELQNISLIINEINTKASLINDIVAKTELLSLNASIESARAGEHGKGFAVVAEEVGNLAKISGKSAKEIQELINKSQEQVSQILEITKHRTEEGKTVTTLVQNSFLEIANNITNISSSIEQINLASIEQKIGINQITQAMEKIEETIQTNLTSIIENSDSSEKLRDESNTINIVINNIICTINGKTQNI